VLNNSYPILFSLAQGNSYLEADQAASRTTQQQSQEQPLVVLAQVKALGASCRHSHLALAFHRVRFFSMIASEMIVTKHS